MIDAPMEPSDDKHPCRSCGQRIARNADPCPSCGTGHPHRAGRVDWGVVSLLVVLSLIGVLGWLLVEQLILPSVEGQPTPRRESPTDPTQRITDERRDNLGSETPEGAPAKIDERLEQFGNIRAPRTKKERQLFAKLVLAEQDLLRTRMEATQSGMPRMWKQMIDEQESRVAELKRKLRELRAARKK